MANDVSKSWFCVLNNPEEHGYVGEPHEIIDRLKEEWIFEHPSRTGAWVYCISAEGLRHVHMVLEDVKAMRFSAIKKSYAVGMHFEPTKGSKEQAEDYINKRGKFKEKGEAVLYSDRHGEIKGAQGSRRDIEVIEELISSGCTPGAIMRMSMSYRRYEKMIRDAYYDKRSLETSFLREIEVVWHVGESGSGKSFVANQIAQERGEDYMYFLSDYDNGCFDKYNGEPILFLDEYRGQFRYSSLLSYLHGYKVQVHARYSNVVSLWNEVHITSVKPPELVYEKMVLGIAERSIDTFEQLRRRITRIVYHWKDASGYHEYSLPMSQYRDYEHLKHEALEGGFVQLAIGDVVPFDS